MKPDELKSWRARLQLTQEAAGKLLGVTRVTVANWEGAVTPIPVVVEEACRIHEMRWKMRDEYGPVTIVYADGPMFQPAYGPGRVPRIRREPFKNNRDAVARACELIGRADVHNMFIIDESGDFVWTSVHLQDECKKRSIRSV